MRMAAPVVALMLAFGGCTSGLFATEATQQVDKAELLLLKDTLTKGARAQATYFVEMGHFAGELGELDLTIPEGIAVSLTQQSIGDYCLTGTHESADVGLWHVSHIDTVPTEGAC